MLLRLLAAAKHLNELRENWLNPIDLVRREPEILSGLPNRLVPIDNAAAQKLRLRTLTNLYNDRPAWLIGMHTILDDAVAAAYGWPVDITDDDALRGLLELNLARSNGS